MTHIAGRDEHLVCRVTTLLGGLALRLGAHAGSPSRYLRDGMVDTHRGYPGSFSPLWRRWEEIFCTHTAENFRVGRLAAVFSHNPATKGHTRAVEASCGSNIWGWRVYMVLTGTRAVQQLLFCGIHAARNQHDGDFLHTRGEKSPR